MTAALSVDVIYAANMKPGDLYAGRVAPGSGRPVLPNAAAIRIATVSPFDGEDGRRMLALTAEGLETPLAWIDAHTQVLVIRGA